MAYFEVDVTPDGTNNAGLTGSDTDFSLAATSAREILIWNQTEAPVDVELVTTHGNVRFEERSTALPDAYERLYERNQYRSYEIDNNVSGVNASFYRITGLQPHGTHVLRVENITTPARDWLDEGSSTMQIRGHSKGNIFNGQRVYVIQFPFN